MSAFYTVNVLVVPLKPRSRTPNPRDNASDVEFSSRIGFSSVVPSATRDLKYVQKVLNQTAVKYP